MACSALQYCLPLACSSHVKVVLTPMPIMQLLKFLTRLFFLELSLPEIMQKANRKVVPFASMLLFIAEAAGLLYAFYF